MKKAARYQPYVQALRQGFGQFHRFTSKQRIEAAVEWSELVKCCVAGAFEYIRETEFPRIPSRLKRNFFLYEVAVSGECLHRFDMCFFDEAFDSMFQCQDLQLVLEAARSYFSGKQATAPVWEIIRDKPARAVKDISFSFKENP